MPIAADRAPARGVTPSVVGVIALGGGLGSVLRYAMGRMVPTGAGGFPVATLVTNLVGSFLLGALVIAVTEVWRPHRLVRPALGTGLLGGFTTFSSFAVELRALPHPVALGYLLASVVGGIVLAATGMSAVRWLEPRLESAPDHGTIDPLDPDLP